MNELVAGEHRIGGWQRALLPRELYEPAAGRSRRDWLIDAASFVAATAAGALLLLHVWSDRGSALNVIDLAVGSTACFGLWGKRSWPGTAAIFAVAASSFAALGAGAALVSVFSAAIRVRGRLLVAIIGLAFVASLIFPVLNPTAGSLFAQRFPGFMLIAIAVSSGLFFRARRELILSLHERAERLEAEQARHVEQARDAERRRIAREMHDVLAHRLSLLSLQAGAFELRPGLSGESAAQATAIRTSAGKALEELRDVIAVLREDGETSTRPQPSIEQIAALVDESRAAGMTVRADIHLPSAESIPEAVGRAAYRVVQEGLTNARKHAPGAPIGLSVSTDGDRSSLVIEVVSRRDGRITAEAAAGGGIGLIGLSERLALIGGTLDHRPEAGGFRLRATIPCEP